MCPTYLLNLGTLAGLLERSFLVAEHVKLVACKWESPGESFPESELLERKQTSERKKADDVTCSSGSSHT